MMKMTLWNNVFALSAAVLAMFPVMGMAETPGETATWGYGLYGTEPSSATLVPVYGQPHAAEVLLVNRLTLATGQEVVVRELVADGLHVGVNVTLGPGDVPDNYFLEVPDGYVAVPNYIDVEEGEDRKVLIFFVEDMPMG